MSFALPVVDTIRALSCHAQLVLCAAVRLFRATKKAETIVATLNDAYTALCGEASIRGISSYEFSMVLQNLEAHALLKGGDAGERHRKVSFKVHEDDVVFALQGVDFFRKLIGWVPKGAGGGAGAGAGAAAKVSAR
jgi:cell division control protein 6